MVIANILFHLVQIFSNKRIFYKKPKRGDLVVFKTPADNRTDYIKRLIGMPGDTIQFINGEIFINNKKIKRKKLIILNYKMWKFFTSKQILLETLPNGIKTYSNL